jgi:hypothetical protein
MAEFTPKNIVQKYAYEKRGILSYLEFERMIRSKPWLVARTTARYWWDEGVPENMRLSSAATLADFLRVKVDDLVEG